LRRTTLGCRRRLGFRVVDVVVVIIIIIIMNIIIRS